MSDLGAQRRGTARTAGMCAVAALTGLIGFSVSASTDVPDTQGRAVALTSADVTQAQTDLTGAGLVAPGYQYYSAYTELGFLNSDTQTAAQIIDGVPNNPFATFVNEMNSGFYDLFHQGPLTNGAIADAGTVLPDLCTGNFIDNNCTGVEVPPLTSFTPGTAPASGETASQLLAQVQNEAAVIDENTDAVHHEMLNLTMPGGTDHGTPLGPDLVGFGGEYGFVSDSNDFQGEIYHALQALGPITPADEHNALLISDLSSLLNGENSMNDTLVDLYSSALSGNALQLTVDNAALAQNGTDIFDAAQNVVNVLAFEGFLSSIGL